jgi:hypothetical protein
VPKFFGDKQAKINSTSFSKSHLGQNRKINICELFWNWSRMGFDISEADMIPTIYENFVGVNGKAER